MKKAFFATTSGRTGSSSPNAITLKRRLKTKSRNYAKRFYSEDQQKAVMEAEEENRKRKIDEEVDPLELRFDYRKERSIEHMGVRSEL